MDLQLIYSKLDPLAPLFKELLPYLFALVFLFALTQGLRLLKSYLIKQLKKLSASKLMPGITVVIQILENTYSWFILGICIYPTSALINLPPKVSQFVSHLLLITIGIQASLWATHLFSFFLLRSLTKGNNEAARLSAINVLNFIGHGIIWASVSLVLLQNLGIDVTTLIAGLGLGGVAVALAVQRVLGDLLGSVSLIMDKPFETGDFIQVGDISGTVEKIGLKTTHIRSLSGEQMILPNTDLLENRIRNFQRMSQRRVVSQIGVVYQTELDKLSRISEIVRTIIEVNSMCKFDRAHFREFAESALIFEVVYFVLSSDYLIFMDAQQEINFKILKVFRENEIEFAYPTRQLIIQNE